MEVRMAAHQLILEPLKYLAGRREPVFTPNEIVQRCRI